MTDSIKFVETLTGALEADGDGTYPVTLLTPGLGTSAFYSESVIARDAPVAFPKGTHIYLTHERAASGEPSPEKLLGTLVSDTTIRESDGAAVNRFKPLKRWAEFVEEVHPHVGLSICAGGTATTGTMDGRTVKIAESIAYHRTNSVDMVSHPGREGSGFVESAYARYSEDVQPEPSAAGKQTKESNMETDEKLDKLIEGLASLATLVESALPKPAGKDEEDAEKALADAVAATRIVESAEIPAELKETLIEGIKDGKTDVQGEVEAYTKLRESIKAEVETEFKESGFAGAQGAGSGTEAVTVKGWGN